MKRSGIVLSLIVAALPIPSQAQAPTEGQCDAAIIEFKTKMIAAQAVRDHYKRNKSQKGRCTYLRSETDHFAEASRILRLCGHVGRLERPSLSEQIENLLQRGKALRNKYCGLQVAEASSIFQIYAASERDLSH